MVITAVIVTSQNFRLKSHWRRVTPPRHDVKKKTFRLWSSNSSLALFRNNINLGDFSIYFATHQDTTSYKRSVRRRYIWRQKESCTFLTWRSALRERLVGLHQYNGEAYFPWVSHFGDAAPDSRAVEFRPPARNHLHLASWLTLEYEKKEYLIRVFLATVHYITMYI